MLFQPYVEFRITVIAKTRYVFFSRCFFSSSRIQLWQYRVILFVNDNKWNKTNTHFILLWFARAQHCSSVYKYLSMMCIEALLYVYNIELSFFSLLSLCLYYIFFSLNLFSSCNNCNGINVTCTVIIDTNSVTW